MSKTYFSVGFILRCRWKDSSCLYTSSVVSTSSCLIVHIHLQRYAQLTVVWYTDNLFVTQTSTVLSVWAACRINSPLRSLSLSWEWVLLELVGFKFFYVSLSLYLSGYSISLISIIFEQAITDQQISLKRVSVLKHQIPTDSVDS